MTAKHTHAPWEPTETMDNVVLVINDRQEVIAKVFTEAFIASEVTANVHLIAAAPELLEALGNLVFLHSCEQEGIGAGMPTPKQWMDAVEAAQKAIEKAKGE